LVAEKVRKKSLKQNNIVPMHQIHQLWEIYELAMKKKVDLFIVKIKIHVYDIENLNLITMMRILELHIW
jgi:hypothetical protein